MGDFDLITLYLAGDSRAFSSLAQRYMPYILRIARRHAHNDYDAWDITQEALLKASQRLHRFRRECSFSTWLYRLVANASYDFYRPLVARELPLIDADAGYERCLSYRHVEAYEPLLWIGEALNKLPEDQREAIFITDILGFPVDEAADRLGCAPGTIKSRRGRARVELRKILGLQTDVSAAAQAVA